MNPHALPATTHSYLARAAESLSEAINATDVPSRYACAHVAALRSAAARLPAPAAKKRAHSSSSGATSASSTQAFFCGRRRPEAGLARAASSAAAARSAATWACA